MASRTGAAVGADDPVQDAGDGQRQGAAQQEVHVDGDPSEREPGQRQLNVTLTQLGRDYARAITAVIEELNREVAGRVGPAELAAADTVLRAALFDDSTRQRATRLPPPPGQPPAGGAVLAGH